MPTTMWRRGLLEGFFVGRDRDTAVEHIYLDRRQVLAKRAYSFLIWKASSRVWHRTKTLTSPSTGSSWCNVANTKTRGSAHARLGSLATMSMPRTGFAGCPCCTSEGCSKPQSTTAATFWASR